MSSDFLYGVLFGMVLGFVLALWVLPLSVDLYTALLRRDVLHDRHRTRDVR